MFKPLHSHVVLVALSSILASGCSAGGKATTTGLPCVTDEDCGSESTCLMGYEELAVAEQVNPPEVGVGLLFPFTGYCTDSLPCTADSDCNDGASCFRPLLEASPTEVSGLDFIWMADRSRQPRVDHGICLQDCLDDAECRTDEGMTCGLPLEEELASVASRPTETYCIPEEADVCAPDTAWNVAGTCTLTYDISGQFEITDAPTSGAEGDSAIGPGRIVVRVPSTDGVNPSDGAASILCYEMEQRFEIAEVVTVVNAFADASGSDGLNSGTLAGTDITWDTCTYSATHCESATSWTTVDPASGPGCVPGYNSVGDVICTFGSLCSVGGLDSGHNEQNQMWTQPWNTLQLSADFGTITMNGTGNPASCTGTPDKLEVPNDTPSRTWFAFTGTLSNMECTAP